MRGGGRADHDQIGDATRWIRAAVTGTRASATSNRSAGTRLDQCPAQTTQSRACRASRLRHSADGTPSKPAVSSLSPAQSGSAARARTTTRAVSSCAFIRCTRTAACCGDSSKASATSARVSSPADSSHHRDSRARSSSSSHRVASAVSLRCPERPSRVMVRSTKSAPGSTTSYPSARPPPAGIALEARSRQCPRIWFMVMATSQLRKFSGSRRPSRPPRTRSMVSCTTSSTSA